MKNCEKFYINGEWVNPVNELKTMDVINPATEDTIGTIAMGDSDDVNIAVKAAKDAFVTFGQTSTEERIEILQKIVELYMARSDEFAEIISLENGSPITLAKNAQAASGIGHFATALATLQNYNFEEIRGETVIRKEPIGVVGMITPWNWPINQISCKVGPAIAAGCTMVLKPTEIAPLNAILLAEVLDEAGLPKGVFNLINGDGPTVGEAMSSHPNIDMMSFTGSTRAGIAVAKGSADSVKRVHQELGGKSANIILDDADFVKAVSRGTKHMFNNTGQSCNAPSRMLVPESRQDEAKEAAKKVADELIVGDPSSEETVMGPVVSDAQFNKIQGLIEKGIEEGAEVVVGGLGKPEGLNQGYFVKPTVFANVSNDMTVAREEIFGPVLSVLEYEDQDEAINIANDTDFGLGAGVFTKDLKKASWTASKLESGQVYVNKWFAGNHATPFGGYKQSGYSREKGVDALKSYLQVKNVGISLD